MAAAQVIVDYEGEAAGFRAEVRAWLAENLPGDWPPRAGRQSPEERAKFRQEWNEKLYAAGWICASWPAEYGGRGLSQLESLILAEEFSRAKAPLRADWFGDTLVGPDDPALGTEEQKKHVHPEDPAGRDLLVPGLLRAGRRARTWPACAPRPGWKGAARRAGTSTG